MFYPEHGEGGAIYRHVNYTQMSFIHPIICAILYGSLLALTFIKNISSRFSKPRRLSKVLKDLKFFKWLEVSFPPELEGLYTWISVQSRTNIC